MVAVNKRILLLACPIFIVIVICLSAIGYSSFKSLPDLQEFIQEGHINQQLQSKSRDLLFLDFSLEAGYQESFKQVYALRAYYFEIISGKVNKKDDVTTENSVFVKNSDAKDPNFATSNPDLHSKINSQSTTLQVTGWHNKDETLTFNDALQDVGKSYTDIQKDSLLFSVLMKGILAPYYLDSQKSSSYDLIYTVGITFPDVGFTVFLPLPTDSMVTLPGEMSALPSNNCKKMTSGNNNFQNVCESTEATLYIIKDYYSNYKTSGGISQEIEINPSVNAIIYAEFQLQQQQSALNQSLINETEGVLFLTLNNDSFSLLAYDEAIDVSTFSDSLITQIFSDSATSKEAIEFKEAYTLAIKSIEDWKIENEGKKYSDVPVNFSFLKKNQKFYCLLNPIEVYPGTVGPNGDLLINDPEIIFFLGYIVSESDLISGFQETNDRLKYIELVSFIVIGVVCLFSGCIVVRYSYMISYSFQNPIITMSKLMQEIDPEHVDQEDQYEQYQNYFTSDEIKSLFEAMVTLLKNFKYSNQRFHDDDALTLLELSRAKQFYLKFGNQNGVGICCNNIGNIHLKNSRYLEAISEYQEAILMATMEYNLTIEEMKKERIEYEHKQYNNDGAMSVNQNSPFPRSKNSAKKKKTFLAQLAQAANPTSPLKKIQMSVMYSSQASSMKANNVNKNFKDSNGVKQPNALNEDDILEGDIENSQIMRMQGQDQTNDLSIQEKKAKDLIMKFELAKVRLINRKYQLGVALFEYSTQQKDDIYHEAIRVFEKCVKLSDQERQNHTNLVRKILILTKKSYCHLRLGEYEKAQYHISEAREVYEKLAVLQIEDSGEDNTSLFLNIFGNIPPEVLKSKIDLQEAILELARFNFRKAAELLTIIIENGEYYDSQIRKYAILCLKNIMEKFQLDIPGLNPKLMKFNLRTIEIIMLIDYSRDMTQEQIKYSHIRCRSIFDRISGKDKIGFAQFNDLVHENFPLQEKELYNDLLEKKIRSIPMSTGGRSNLFNALEVSTRLFDKKQQISELEEKEPSRDSIRFSQATNLQGNNEVENMNQRLRFICLFTEGNNQISEQDLIEIKIQMQKKQVNLIIINICRQNANMLYLRFLAKELGQFFQEGDNDVEEYLIKQRELPVKRQLIAEYF